MNKNFEQIKDKIVDVNYLKNIVSQLKAQKKHVVFTNGCFDILHLGHIDYLAKTRDLGDFLIIGLNSDNSVTKLKGPKRPIIDEYSRAMHLAAFSFVDAVILFDEETPFDLISSLIPDILVKGGDYIKSEIIGADIVRNNGGKVITIPYLEGYSTTNIINKITEIDKE